MLIRFLLICYLQFVYVLLLVWPLSSHGAVVIQYHHIDSQTPAATSVTPVMFQQHMQYLHQQDFEVWPLARLIQTIQQGQPLPARVVSITFDDGYESILTHAHSILRHYSFPYTVFINPGLVSKKHYLDWGQLELLHSEGVTIANHTWDHPHLVRQTENESPDDWKKRVREQISSAEIAIIQRFGSSPGLFAYPYGEYNTVIQGITKQLGLTGFAQHSGAFDDSVDWQAVPRFAFGGSYANLDGYQDKVNSLPMPVVRARITDGHGRTLIEPLLPTSISQPMLIMQLPSQQLAQRVQCFASGQGRIDVSVKDTSIHTQPSAPLPVGRSRINCTATSDQPDRFYWYSAFFMRKQGNGDWYQEP